MAKIYVVREWVHTGPKPGAKKELLTHLEYGTFTSYDEANNCAKLVGNGRRFPQQIEAE